MPFHCNIVEKLKPKILKHSRLHIMSQKQDFTTLWEKQQIRKRNPILNQLLMRDFPCGCKGQNQPTNGKAVTT